MARRVFQSVPIKFICDLLLAINSVLVEATGPGFTNYLNMVARSRLIPRFLTECKKSKFAMKTARSPSWRDCVDSKVAAQEWMERMERVIPSHQKKEKKRETLTTSSIRSHLPRSTPAPSFSKNQSLITTRWLRKPKLLAQEEYPRKCSRTRGGTWLPVPSGEGPARLVAYADADFAGGLDTRRATTGTVILCGAALYWRSRLQKCVALSTAEAELVALCESGKDTLLLQSSQPACRRLCGFRFEKDIVSTTLRGRMALNLKN